MQLTLVKIWFPRAHHENPQGRPYCCRYIQREIGLQFDTFQTVLLCALVFSTFSYSPSLVLIMVSMTLIIVMLLVPVLLLYPSGGNLCHPCSQILLVHIHAMRTSSKLLMPRKSMRLIHRNAFFTIFTKSALIQGLALPRPSGPNSWQEIVSSSFCSPFFKQTSCSLFNCGTS